MADEIKEEAQPVEAQALDAQVVGAAKEETIKDYTNEKGETVKYPESILTPESLNKVDAITFDKIQNLKEPNEANTCRTCRFWKPTLYRPYKKIDVPIQGVCRFNVPEIIPGMYPVEGRFPPVGPYEWCGKFEPIA